MEKRRSGSGHEGILGLFGLLVFVFILSISFGTDSGFEEKLPRDLAEIYWTVKGWTPEDGVSDFLQEHWLVSRKEFLQNGMPEKTWEIRLDWLLVSDAALCLRCWAGAEKNFFLQNPYQVSARTERVLERGIPVDYIIEVAHLDKAQADSVLTRLKKVLPSIPPPFYGPLARLKEAFDQAAVQEKPKEETVPVLGSKT